MRAIRQSRARAILFHRLEQFGDCFYWDAEIGSAKTLTSVSSRKDGGVDRDNSRVAIEDWTPRSAFRSLRAVNNAAGQRIGDGAGGCERPNQSARRQAGGH